MKKNKSKWEFAGVVMAALAVMISAWGVKNNNLGISSKAADPTYQQVFSNLIPARGYLPWKDWYPVDYGQSEGYRMVNWWSSAAVNTGGKGNVYLNVPNKVNSLPEVYKGNLVDYFYIWSCPNVFGVDQCYRPGTSGYMEIISQGTAVDTVGKTTLEHWARGTPTSWEVYYDPEQIGWNNCDGNAIRNTTLDLNNPGNKKPMVLKLPDTANTYYATDPVCALVYSQYEQSKTAVKDVRYVPYTTSGSPTWWAGNWLLLVINHESYKDGLGKSIIRAENIYLTDNVEAGKRFSTEYCQGVNPSDTLHCTGVGNKTGLTYVKNGRTYYSFAYEEYWMRKSESSGKTVNLQGALVRDLYGFGAFRWYNWAIGKSIWDGILNDGSKSNDNGAGNQVYTMEKCTLDKYNNIVACAK